MKGLKDILLSSLLVSVVGCSSLNETAYPDIPIVLGNPKKIEVRKEVIREPILPDIYGAHELAFPDTSKYRMMGWTISLLFSDLSRDLMLAETLFDADHDSKPDLVVFYRLKHFNDITEDNEIDSSRAPPMIIKLDKKYGPSRYEYNQSRKKYFRIPEIIRTNRNSIRKA